MTYYEIKKVFSKRSNRFSLLVLGLLLLIVLYFMISDTVWINGYGDGEKGLQAIHKIKEAKKEWSGELTEDRIREVIEKNNQINGALEYLSDDVRELDRAYGKKQGFLDIRMLLSYSYGGFQDFDYYMADSLTPDRAGEFYQNRMDHLVEWLNAADGGADFFNEKEKAFLIEEYENLATPLFYDYQDGWDNLFQWSPAIAMITTMVLAFLCAGIFSDEFRLKSSSIFYSSYHGRKKATWAKIKAGFMIATMIYWSMMLLYSVVVLGIFGADGAGCPIQSAAGSWKSFYNLTNGQVYLLILLGAYLGCLFMTFLVMFVSAAAKSSLLAVLVPFVLIFLPSFLMGTDIPALNKILGLLPDQLLQMNLVVKYFNLYEIGGKIFGAVPVLLVLYLLLTLVLIPVIYKSYKNHQVAG